MRQIGTLPTESEAKRFTAYLITEGISVHAEQDGAEWAIWIRDENHLEKAREEFSHFREHPNDVRYEGVEQQADTMLRKEVKRHEQARKHVVQMGDKWGQGEATRRTPIVFVLIIGSILATIWTNFGKDNTTFRRLSFYDTVIHHGIDAKNANIEEVFVDIRKGQVWRLLSPVFVHLSILHLIFNMYWTFVLGAQIERLRGSLRFALIVVLAAVISNIAQAGLDYPVFGGMSGVGYGLFGYVWMKTLYEPTSGFMLAPSTVALMVIWFFVCLSGAIGGVANTAHLAGFVVGAGIGLAPIMFRSRTKG
ncbi:MAG: rhomboid family intramembrane serine protease [Planctomycetes bacterium]|nr:rhomboid family intramembrane serine protease [Planctomycetota bacterium]